MVFSIIPVGFQYLSLPYAVQHILAFIALLAGSYTDIKTREVPDWANLGLIGIGFGINLIFSIIYWKINFLLASIIGFAVFFSLALIMFYTGQWGGGDSKMIMGLGAVIGIDILLKHYFLLSFLFNALVVGAVYGIFWSLMLIFKNKSKFLKEFRISLKSKEVKNSRIIAIISFFITVTIALLAKDTFARIMFFYLAIIIAATFYLLIVVKAVEISCMLKYVKPHQLTEGDWIAKDVKIDGKYITGPKDLGIEKRKIKRLIKFYKKGKIKKVLIKEGIPFVPSFFIAYALTFFYGNILLMMI